MDSFVFSARNALGEFDRNRTLLHKNFEWIPVLFFAAAQLFRNSQQKRDRGKAPKLEEVAFP